MQKVQLGNNNTMGGNAFKSWRRRWWLWLLVVGLLGWLVFSRLFKTRMTEGPVPGLRPVQASVAVTDGSGPKGGHRHLSERARHGHSDQHGYREEPGGWRADPGVI